LGALAAAHKSNPADPDAALAYARALRSVGAKAQALAILDETSAAKPNDHKLLLERGLLALDLGQASKAETLLSRAADHKAPDWRVHSALGAALASRGKQQAAQAQFAKALALAPDHPSVVSNLALSYALDGKMEEAEKLLRKAQRANPKARQIQQNLALVLGLRGKYDEARTVAESVLPPAKAAQNVAYLQNLAGNKHARRPEKKNSTVAGAEPPPANTARASLPQPIYQLAGPRASP
jgi:Flp pilus assembly protein TadD